MLHIAAVSQSNSGIFMVVILFSISSDVISTNKKNLSHSEGLLARYLSILASSTSSVLIFHDSVSGLFPINSDIYSPHVNCLHVASRITAFM